MIRIGIAEDQALVRESLAIVLGLQPDVEVAWTAVNGAEAVDAANREPVDVVLMDLRMPGMDGVSAMRAIRTRHPHVQMIVLTTFHHDEWMIDALNAGAAACFLKEIPPHLLMDAIRRILSASWVPEEWSPEWRKYAPEIQFEVRGRFRGMAMDTLTARELEVLRVLCQGRTNAEIASVLYLTEGTVKNYVSGIYSKLGVRHRADAIRIAREKGLC
ncbi:DNA-binding response regulator [Alicyclobacillus contaminans]|uniref:response regulator transcription factor n=1 Tax=Alicyclobacillus contaminans TaxID=392016 RepID=UPI00041ED562|nr:response regulator transcription factor [Alicyclobacillus contaminans]GMA51331.1 DNA-binding response regulator [Alicyclobacillus contaminans]